MDLKKNLAHRIVVDYHGKTAADRSRDDWEAQFQERGLPSELPQRSCRLAGPRELFRVLADLGLAESNVEAQRKIKEGAVYMSVGDLKQPRWQKLTDPRRKFNPQGDSVVVFRVGRRLLKVMFSSKE